MQKEVHEASSTEALDGASTSVKNESSQLSAPITDTFEETYAELRKWADINLPKYLLLTVKREKRSGRLGNAFKVKHVGLFIYLFFLEISFRPISTLKDFLPFQSPYLQFLAIILAKTLNYEESCKSGKNVLATKMTYRLSCYEQFLNDLIQDESKPPQKSLFELRIKLLEELEWPHLAEYERKWQIVRFPSSYPPF